MQIGAAHGMTLFDIGCIMYKVEHNGQIPQQSELTQLIRSCFDVTIAVEGSGERISKTLSGLNLQTPKPSRSSTSSMGSAVPSQLSSPSNLPVPSPLLSPLSLPIHCGELPGCLLLDGLSLSDTPTSPDGATCCEGFLLGTELKSGQVSRVDEDMMTAHDLLRLSEEDTDAPMRRPSSKARSQRKTIRSQRSACSETLDGKATTDEETNDCDSIFSRLPDAEWTPQFEKAFRRRMTDMLTEHVKKKILRIQNEASSIFVNHTSSMTDTSMPTATSSSGHCLDSAFSSLRESSPGVAAQGVSDTAKYMHPFRREAQGVKEAVPDIATSVAPTPSMSSTSPRPNWKGFPKDASGGHGRYGYCLSQNQRPYMEDAVDLHPSLPGAEESTEFYAVHDGHGGTGAVEFVRRRLRPLVCAHPGFNDESGLMEALSEAFIMTDQEHLNELDPPSPKNLCDAAPSAPIPPAPQASDLTRATSVHKELGGDNVLSPGCVTCVAVLRGGFAYVAHLGDVRAVLCNGGEMEHLTEDHCPFADVERQRLGELGVEVSSDGYMHGRICVSRAFGDWVWDSQEKCPGVICKPEVQKVPLVDNSEFLLLACDGIFEKLSSKEAAQVVRRRLRTTGCPQAASEALVKEAHCRGSQDNLSVVVVLFKLPPKVSDSERSAPRLFSKRTILPE